MRHTFILLLGAMLSLQGQAQDKQLPFQNTIKVEAGDSHADIIAKAAHVVPSPNQLAALQNEFIAISSISGRTVLPAWNGEAERKTRKSST